MDDDSELKTWLTGIINQKNEKGETPLCVACRYGNQAAVETLLIMGGDVLLCDDQGKGFLHWVVEGADEKILQLALTYLGQKELLATVLEARDQTGGTAILSAAKAGNWLAVKALAMRDADVFTIDYAANSVFHFVAECGEPDLWLILMRKAQKLGVPVSMRHIVSPWSWLNNWLLVEALLKKGALPEPGRRDSRVLH